jgi:hypothetical protein
MPEPQTFREMNIWLGEFRAGLENRLDGILERFSDLKTWVGAIFGSIVTLVVAVGGLYAYVYFGVLTKIDDLKTDLLAKIGALQQSIAVLESQSKELKATNDRMLSTLLSTGRNDQRLPTSPPSGPEITASDALFIRQFVKTSPITTATPQKIKVGDQLSDATLTPLPDDLIARLPKLKGVRYSIDPENNLIALADPSGRVFALV